MVAIEELVPAPEIAPPGWTVVRELARGGTSRVVIVTRDRTQAVAKVGSWRDRDVRARFAIEADVLRRIGPPTTPALLDTGTLDGWPYIVMEHVGGDTLATWMSRNGARGGLGEILAILSRLATALGALHDGGFVHRDLKPENIVIADGIRLLDFGLAKSPSGDDAVTQIGSIVGTLHYIAPEQLQSGSSVDPRTDIYSFGVVAFEMLTGRPPFTGDRRAIEYHHTVVRPPPVRELRDVPAALDELVLACLAKTPEGRPRHAAEVRDRLAAAEASLDTLRGIGGPTARPLGASVRVALALIVGGDPVAVTAAVNQLHGVVVRARGHGVLAAFTALDHDHPVTAALALDGALDREQVQIAVHATTCVVRRTAYDRVAIYGADVDAVDRWLPHMPFRGTVITAAAAADFGDTTADAELPGWFRVARRDRTDRRDARGEPPLVGRDELVRRIAGEVASRSVAVTGPAGSGKSRVLDAVAELLAHEHVRTVRGRPRFAGEPADDRDAIAAIRDAASHRGIVIADDVHWLSAETRRHLAAVRYIAASPAPTELSGTAIDMPPLSYAHVQALSRVLLHPARLLPAVLLERIAVRSTGNPGLLVALLRDIKRRGRVRRHAGSDDWYVAVDEIDTLLESPGSAWVATCELDELPLEIVPIVRVAAVLGPRFGPAELAAAVGRDAGDEIAWLVQQRLLVRDGDEVRFADDRLQDAIADLDLDDRIAIHARVYAQLVAAGREGLAELARIAFHAAGAGHTQVAAACWATLGQAALARGELDDARALYARSSSLLESRLPPAVAGMIRSVRATAEAPCPDPTSSSSDRTGT